MPVLARRKTGRLGRNGSFRLLCGIAGVRSVSTKNLSRSTFHSDSERKQDRLLRPFAKLRSLGAAAMLGVAIAAASAISPAGAVTATGVAVGSVGSSAQVGVIADGLILDDAIKYFIPLNVSSGGTYGTFPSSCLHGVGTCSNTGSGGGLLTMILRFSPVSTIAPSILSVIFEDLDLKHANDPAGFLEKLRILKGDGSPLTNWITQIGGLVTGDHDLQTLTLSLGTLTSDPLYLLLLFKAKSDFLGTNTPEYLIASITSPDRELPPVPLPGAVWLLGTVLVGAAGFAKWRKRRLA